MKVKSRTNDGSTQWKLTTDTDNFQFQPSKCLQIPFFFKLFIQTVDFFFHFSDTIYYAKNNSLRSECIFEIIFDDEHSAAL